MTPEQLALLLAQDNARLNSAFDVLDERELELFSILAQGYSSCQIRSEFGIAPQETRALKKRIMKKLKLKSESELLQLARISTGPLGDSGIRPN
jgi:DNA-binding CsgD family transcriptional regulator